MFLLISEHSAKDKYLNVNSKCQETRAVCDWSSNANSTPTTGLQSLAKENSCRKNCLGVFVASHFPATSSLCALGVETFDIHSYFDV